MYLKHVTWHVDVFAKEDPILNPLGLETDI